MIKHGGNVTELFIFGAACSEGLPVVACTCKTCRYGTPRKRAGYAIKMRNETLWLETSPDFREQILQLGFLPQYIFVSHPHFDHIAGISELRQWLLVSGTPRTERPTLLVPKHLHEWLLAHATTKETAPGAYKELVELEAVDLVVLEDGTDYVLGSFSVLPFSEKHGNVMSTAIKITTEDGSILYLADAKEIPKGFRGTSASLVLAHTPYLTSMDDHIGAEDVVKNIRAQLYILSHLSHSVNMSEYELQRYAEEHFGSNVIIARDGQRIILSRERIEVEDPALNMLKAYSL